MEMRNNVFDNSNQSIPNTNNVLIQDKIKELVERAPEKRISLPVKLLMLS